MIMMLPRYKIIANELEDNYNNGIIEEDDLYIQFNGQTEKTRMIDIANEIEKQMNLAWNYVINNEVIDDINDQDYESFISAKTLFVNSNNVPYGGAQYGIIIFKYIWYISIYI